MWLQDLDQHIAPLCHARSLSFSQILCQYSPFFDVLLDAHLDQLSSSQWHLHDHRMPRVWNECWIHLHPAAATTLLSPVVEDVTLIRIDQMLWLWQKDILSSQYICSPHLSTIFSCFEFDEPDLTRFTHSVFFVEPTISCPIKSRGAGNIMKHRGLKHNESDTIRIQHIDNNSENHRES